MSRSVEKTALASVLMGALILGWDLRGAAASGELIFRSESADSPTSPQQYACRRANDNVELRGFAFVRMIECKGKHYSFKGYRDGKWWKVKVRARNGKVPRIYPL